LTPFLGFIAEVQLEMWGVLFGLAISGSKPLDWQYQVANL